MSQSCRNIVCEKLHISSWTLGNSSARHKHPAKWNLVMDYAGRLAETLVEEGPGPSKKRKTGRPPSHYQPSLLNGEVIILLV